LVRARKVLENQAIPARRQNFPFLDVGKQFGIYIPIFGVWAGLD
jgi:hypothetical protein